MLGGTLDGPQKIMNYFKEYFCSDRNCQTSFCSNHCMYKFKLLIFASSVYFFYIIHSTVSPVPPKKVAPEIAYVKLVDSIHKPCGVNCFLHPKRNVIVSSCYGKSQSGIIYICFL